MKRTVKDVMTRTVVVVSDSSPFKDVVRRIQEYRVSAVPVVDQQDRLVGIVSEGDLILKEDAQLEGDPRLLEGRHRRIKREKHAGLVAGQLMTTPVITVEPDASLGDAARLMYRHGVKRLPVVGARGDVLGIVSRADLLKVFLRDDAEIAAEIREDVIRRTLWIEPSSIRVMVRDGVVRLEGQIERRSLIPVVVGLVQAVEGVVGVENHLSHLEDDTLPSPELPLPWTAITPGPGR
ncbi:MAG TPA: CBS domain-containing protein [Actinomycetota bacterium]|jgi:CBS domain-containing protein|nr:CBS domain-containing protein [Actinomycetota bacterium]